MDRCLSCMYVQYVCIQYIQILLLKDKVQLVTKRQYIHVQSRKPDEIGSSPVLGLANKSEASLPPVDPSFATAGYFSR